MIVCPNQWAVFVPCNPYGMNIDRENRNCYNCGGFGHLARNYRNRRIRDRIGEGRKLKYRRNKQRIENNEQNNLNGEGDLIVLN